MKNLSEYCLLKNGLNIRELSEPIFPNVEDQCHHEQEYNSRPKRETGDERP